ncbi:melanocyte-stimulating hormone receptor [Exaiptasia diaphana]|uniref:G-protein coupled receptors family 1 profile domain-containing protein n=1 Tax=Exaiptasia diaphana TaxID=2652724 RepID=A0A913WPM1_EXADI|nr:melanocyte-stimulating hormone receptor [Exaiptasia diaphana]
MNGSGENFCHAASLGLSHTIIIQTVVFLTNTLNIIGSIAAILQNSIIIWTVRKHLELHQPSFVLLACLAFADLLSGSTSQPSWVAYRLAEYYQMWRVACCSYTIFKLSNLWHYVSFLTLTIITIDRFLALHYHLRYMEMVTIPRVLVAYGMIWITSIALLVPTFTNDYALTAIVLLTASFLCFIIILMCYYQIYKITRRHHRQIRNQDSTHSMAHHKSRMIKIKKSSTTYLLVTMVLFVSVFPVIAYFVSYIVIGYKGFVVWFLDVSVALWLLTTAINPMVYFWRMTELRRAVKMEMKRSLRRNNNIIDPGNHRSSRQSSHQSKTRKETWNDKSTQKNHPS